ncbi:MAG: hypothetical protein AB7F64_02185 [Gammaproteobacteria bacterium]
MPKKAPTEFEEPKQAEFDEWLAENEIDLFDDHEVDEHADDLLHTISHFVASGVELTRIVVETERSQNIPLKRQDIFDIFNAAMENVGKSILSIGEVTSTEM